MALTTLLLDLDGTLVDATEAILDGVVELAAEAGLALPDRDWLRSRIGHEPTHTWELLGAPDPTAIVDRFTERILPRLPEHTRVLPGVRDTLAALHDGGFLLAVATTRLTTDAWTTLRVTELDGWVRHVSGRDLVAHAKPEPDILLHALEAIEATPGGAVMIGDSVADVLAARAASLPCWAVLGGTGTEKSLREAGATRILAGGLGDVPSVLAELRDGVH